MSIKNYFDKITVKDKYLLEEMVNSKKPSSKAYEDAWGYIIQATRNNGSRWWNASKKALIFFGTKPADEKTLVIPNFFAEPEYLIKVIAEVQPWMGCTRTILKNIAPEDILKFRSFGFREYNSNEYWDSTARFDDQTYPQLIVNVNSLVNLSGKKFKNFRNNVSHNNRIFTFRNYTSDDLEEVLKLFSWKDQIEYRKTGKADGPFFTSHSMYPKAEIDKFVVTLGNSVKGFVAASNISSKYFALCASIIEAEERGVTVWSTHQLCRKKLMEGFEFINLGGSEDLGTHTFKTGNYRPTDWLYRTHLVY